MTIATQTQPGAVVRALSYSPEQVVMSQGVLSVSGSGQIEGLRWHALAEAMVRHRTLLLILGMGLLLRVGLLAVGPWQEVDRAFYPDSPRYVELADNLARFGCFGLAMPSGGVVHVPLAKMRTRLGMLPSRDTAGLEPSAFRTPGYPMFIAAFEGLGFGLRAVLVAQCVLSVGSVLLVYLIGRQLFSRRAVALLAAGLMAVNPESISMSVSVMSETLFIFLMLAGVYLAMRERGREGFAKRGLAGGVVIGLSVLVRPISVLMGLAMAMWLGAVDRRWRSAGAGLVMLVSSLVLPGVWAWRNYETGYGYTISTVPAVNAYFYTDAYMRITAAGGDLHRDWPATVHGLFLRLDRARRPGERPLQAARRLAVDDILAQPGLYAKVMVRSVAKFFTDHSLGGLLAKVGMTWKPTGLKTKLLHGGWTWSQVLRPGLLAAGAWTLWNLLAAMGMLAGLAAMVWRRRWAAAMLIGGLVFYFAFATQANGLERFRLPVAGFEYLAVGAVLVGGVRHVQWWRLTHRSRTGQGFAA